jgi:hypothetical protein
LAIRLLQLAPFGAKHKRDAKFEEKSSILLSGVLKDEGLMGEGPRSTYRVWIEKEPSIYALIVSE